jgi:hypothetical protein
VSSSSDEIVFIVEEAPGGGYRAHAPDCGIFTDADSLRELRHAIRDALRCHFGEADRPNVIRLHFMRERAVRCDDPFACFEEWVSDVDTLGYSLLGRSDKPAGD